MSNLYVESTDREHQLAWELIEQIGRCSELEEGRLVDIISGAFARYRAELQQGFGENTRFTTERIQELEQRIADLTLKK